MDPTVAYCVLGHYSTKYGVAREKSTGLGGRASNRKSRRAAGSSGVRSCEILILSSGGRDDLRLVGDPHPPAHFFRRTLVFRRFMLVGLHLLFIDGVHAALLPV